MAAAAKKASKSAQGARRQEQPRNGWTKPAAPKEYGREEFRFTLLRTSRRLPTLNIDPFVEHANWERGDIGRTGELNFRRPLTARGASEIAHGDVVRCELATSGEGNWRRLWQMTVKTPTHDIVPGLISLALATQLKPAYKNKASFKFRKDKQHPRGWRADQITRSVAKRFHIPIGRVARGTHYITRLVETNAGPVDVIVKAWRREREVTGRRYDVDLSRGILEVLELKRPQYMLLLGPAITEATIEHRTAGVTSALVATATRHAKGKRSKRRLLVKVTDPARLRRYGYIVKTVKAPRGVDTISELRRWAKARLAREHAPRQDVTFTHPGLPWVDRGDAITLDIPEDGLRQLVYVTAVRHDVSAGSYTMQVTVAWTDPWKADEREQRVKLKKAAAARRRNRPGGTAAKPPTPKKARTRGDA